MAGVEGGEWRRWAERAASEPELRERRWIADAVTAWQQLDEAEREAMQVIELRRDPSEYDGQEQTLATVLEQFGLGVYLGRFQEHGFGTLEEVAAANPRDLMGLDLPFEEARVVLNLASAHKWGTRLRFVHRSAPLNELNRIFAKGATRASAFMLMGLVERGLESMEAMLGDGQGDWPGIIILERQRILEELRGILIDADISLNVSGPNLGPATLPPIAAIPARRASHRPATLKLPGGLVVSGLQHVTELPGLRVEGSLWVRNCVALERFEPGLRVEEDLHVSLCPALQALSARRAIAVGRHLSIVACYQASAVITDPQGAGLCAVGGCLTLHQCDIRTLDDLRCGGTVSLRKLPRLHCLRSDGRLLVKGALAVRSCPALRELPPRMAMQEGQDQFGCEPHVDLHGLRSLTALPPRTRFPGDLKISNCPSLASLPERLQVAGELYLRACSSLRRLPALRLQASLWVRECPIEDAGPAIDLPGSCVVADCPTLRTLPRIRVGRSLEIDSCVNLRVLSSLEVGENLWLTNCPSVERLPEEIWVGGDADLSGCLSVRTLPNTLMQWGASESGRPHSVYLIDTGLAQDDLARLRRQSNINLRFHVSMPSAQRAAQYGMAWNQPDFATVQEAVTFWAAAAHFEEELQVDAYVPKDSRRGFLLFLSKLKGSREFEVPELRLGLAKRVMEALETLCSDEYAREELLARMVDSVDACSDKPIWALNQMLLMSKVARARGDGDALRRLGRRILNLAVVHQHAAAKIAKLSVIDDVCVYLKFEIELREALDLPVSAIDMLFPNYIAISQDDLDACTAEARGISDAAFEAWLRDWPEWQRFERHQVAKSVNWKALQRNSRRFSISWTDLFGSSLSDPVRLHDNVWSLDDLLRHWVATGNDLNNVPTSSDELLSALTRCASRASSRMSLRSSRRSSSGLRTSLHSRLSVRSKQ